MSGKISVLMGIFNCEDTLEQAVDSLEKGGDVPDFILPDLY